MKKIKIKGLNKEMSTTGTGASFAAGTGAQYATPKAFKKKKDEIGEPFTIPNPSIPNRKSKFIDYKQLFEKAKKAIKYNPITDFTDSQAWAGDNTGYDMDTQDAASVLELAKTSKKGEFKVGDIAIERVNGTLTHYTRNNMEKFTGIIYNNEKGNMGLVVNGLRTDFWRTWDVNQSSRYDKAHYIEVEYGSNGLADGLIMYWYSDGSIAEQFYMRSGEFNGEYIAWYNNGQLAEKTTYNMGSEISTKKWDRYGNKK